MSSGSRFAFHSLRGRLLLTLTSIAGLGVWAACGGDDDSATAADAGTDTSVIDTYVPPVADTGTITTPPSGPDRDGGTPNILDGSALGVDGGIPCYEGGELEIEPNGDLVMANSFPAGAITSSVLKRILCGAASNPTYVDGGNIDAGDQDFMQFTLADASTGFYVGYEGNVDVTVETDGEAPVDITLADASIRTFSKSQPYYVRVKSREGHTQKWKIIVFQDQGSH